ncbi:MAG: DUF58 domain-containing protein [Archaeoglobaceae archaeon]|nr:DUF58 domain-containing protein [Archaeoglobaceae archaeon]MDW8014365.1 DUF58 domain-containing protein [Archaeoglobaceae archaeon]
MNAKILALTIFFLCAQSYLLQNIFPALLAFSIATYVFYVYLEFEPKIEAYREVERVLYEGKRTSAKLKVKNFTRKVYKIKLLEEPSFSEKVEFLSEPGEKSFEYSLIPLKGVYRIKGSLEIFDSREIFEKKLRIPEVEVEVLPSVEAIKEKTKIGAPHRSVFGIETDFHSLRKFVFGDDAKKIEWKASARLGELIVKEFLKEWEGDFYIVFDASREMRKKLDFSLKLVFLLLNSLKGKRVGLVVYDEFGVKRFVKASEDFSQIKSELKINPTKAELSLKVPKLVVSKLLRSFLKKMPTTSLDLIKKIPRKSFLIFISDLSNPDELLRVILEVKKECKVFLISPNPVLFYRGVLTKDVVLKLYRAYVEREELIRKINSVVPTIDVGPGDDLFKVRT